MRKMISLILVCLLSLTAVTGCKKAAETPTNKIAENAMFDMTIVDGWEDSSIPDAGVFMAMTSGADESETGAYLMISYVDAGGQTASAVIETLKQDAAADEATSKKDESSGTFTVGKYTAEYYRVTISSEHGDSFIAVYCFVEGDVIYSFMTVGTAASYISTAEGMLASFTLKSK